MADLYADEVKTAFNMQGYLYRADPTDKYATEGEPGRSDLIVIRGGHGVALEIKSDHDSFAFKNWRDNQRQWYADWCVPNKIPYWIWLNMGEVNVNRAQGKKPIEGLMRRAWLMPIDRLLEVENLLYSTQDSIPYLAEKGFSTVLQTNQWDAVHLFKDYELFWQKLPIPWDLTKSKYCWTIPTTHSFDLFFKD